MFGITMQQNRSLPMFAGFNPPLKKPPPVRIPHVMDGISPSWRTPAVLPRASSTLPLPRSKTAKKMRRKTCWRWGDGINLSFRPPPKKKNEKRGTVMYQNASLLCCIRFYCSPVDPVSFRGRVKRTMFSSIYYQDSSKTGGATEHRHASSLQNIVTVSSSQVSASTWTDLRHILRLRKPNHQRIR